MRSAWVCTRNDVLGNLAVLLAAVGVFGTGTGWPDVIVATIMAGLALQGAWIVLRQSRHELRISIARLMCGGLRGPMDRVQSVSSSKALVIRARTIEALAGGSPGQGAPALSDRLRFLRVVPDEADQECEDHAADRAAADVPDPALDRLSRDRADELADDAAADRARDRVAQCADRIVLGRGACRAAADRARNDLNEKTGEIHFAFPPCYAALPCGAPHTTPWEPTY